MYRRGRKDSIGQRRSLGIMALYVRMLLFLTGSLLIVTSYGESIKLIPINRCKHKACYFFVVKILKCSPIHFCCLLFVVHFLFVHSASA